MENPDGLLIRWTVTGKTTQAEFTPVKKFQGWKDVVHGGILATLLDEAMTRLAWIACGGALTASISVRYLRPARIGKKLFIHGEIVSENRRIVEMKSTVRQGGRAGELVAHASGKAVKFL